MTVVKITCNFLITRTSFRATIILYDLKKRDQRHRNLYPILNDENLFGDFRVGFNVRKKFQGTDIYKVDKIIFLSLANYE